MVHRRLECLLIEEDEILQEFRPDPGNHVLLVTGRLAEAGLQRMMEAINPQDFTYEIRVLGEVQIAAWLTVEAIAELVGDLDGVDILLIPGKTMGDDEELQRRLGIKVVRGPGCYSELPVFLEEKGFEPGASDNVPRPHIIVLGATEGARSTARFLASTYEIPLFVLGDLLDREIAQGSAAGKSVQASLAAGEPPRHNVMAELIRAETSTALKGWVVCGYPTTERDIQWLEDMSIKPDAVLALPGEVGIDAVLADYAGKPQFIALEQDGASREAHEAALVRVETLLQQCVIPDMGQAEAEK